jgi:hypothetical protein
MQEKKNQLYSYSNAKIFEPYTQYSLAVHGTIQLH